MATTVNKQRLLNQLLSGLGKPGKAEEPGGRPILEQFVYAVCREGTTRELADQAYHALRDRFYDWNEVRVSSPREVADAIDMLPGSEARAQRIDRRNCDRRSTVRQSKLFSYTHRHARFGHPNS